MLAVICRTANTLADVRTRRTAAPTDNMTQQARGADSYEGLAERELHATASRAVIV